MKKDAIDIFEKSKYFPTNENGKWDNKTSEIQLGVLK